MLYPALAPRRTGRLDVGDGHHLYWEESGNPDGTPVAVLHGGPGGGATEISRRWFDPRYCRIITFDQRGCGRSIPHASIQHNTTRHLVGDLEQLRAILDVDEWILLGRSWGTTLALAYAEAHPERVSAIVLCAVFTARRKELDWLYRGGAAHLVPQAWGDFVAPIPLRDRSCLIGAYHERLTCGDPAVELASARSWCAWEDALARLPPVQRIPDDRDLLARARIGAHYFRRAAFLTEGELVTNARRLSGIPGMIVQGRQDVVTPPMTAWELHQAWPGSRLQLVPDGGHATCEPAMMRALVDATDAIVSSLLASRLDDGFCARR